MYHVVAATDNTIELWDGETYIDKGKPSQGKSTILLVIDKHPFKVGDQGTLIFRRYLNEGEHR